jgi:hypothetical protein
MPHFLHLARASPPPSARLQYAVDRIAEAYAKVMGSPHYIARVAAEPYFVLESIQRAFVRVPPPSLPDSSTS